jgi:peptidoglycan/LPS O-acetylase OafA/YrhL
VKYLPALDGLRAVAILAVLVFHAMPGTLKGGFTGVDVFFVLSGYLITSVILYDIREGHFSMRRFYLRRVQRLLSNAVCMVFVTALLSYIAVLPLTAAKVAQHGFWTLVNLSNVYIWLSAGGYWGDSANSLPLLHTWSLAVEEQFYILFPIALWILTRGPRPLLFAATVCLTLLSFVLSVYGTWAYPAATFYLLPTRAWEPLLGALLATYRVPTSADLSLRTVNSRLISEFVGWAGMALIVFGFVFIDESYHFPGWIALVPTLGAVAVIVSIANAATTLGRVLSVPLMVLIGKLSYSIYLWHWPLIVIGRKNAELAGKTPQTGELVGAGIGLVLSVIAFWVVEQPSRLRGAGQNWRPRILATCLFFCATASLLVLIIRSSKGSLSDFDRPVYHGLQYNVIDLDPARELTKATKFSDVLLSPAEPHRAQIWKTGGIMHD